MKLINKEKKIELEIEDTLLDKLSSIALQHYPNEFGGFLIGYYASNFKSLIITDYILPNKYKSDRYLFERSTNGIEKKLKKLFTNTKQQYYVGEWHTHPDGSINYSTTDLKAMNNIVESNSIRIENPILLIISVGINKTNDYGFYIFNNNKLLKYE